MNGVEDILQNHRLKNTKLRKAVLSVLMGSDKGLSHQDLTKALDVEFDRVTLFRTLHSFEENGILHKIIDPNGTAKYAYTPPEESAKEHCHAHFICLKCEEVFCLEELFPLEEVKVPRGIQQKSY
jgi:Fur family ferric uptake transcriptional regulator